MLYWADHVQVRRTHFQLQLPFPFLPKEKLNHFNWIKISKIVPNLICVKPNCTYICFVKSGLLCCYTPNKLANKFQ